MDGPYKIISEETIEQHHIAGPGAKGITISDVNYPYKHDVNLTNRIVNGLNVAYLAGRHSKMERKV